MRAGTGRKLRASPARASLSAASASARYSEAIDGCCPAFLPVLMTSFLAMPGTGGALVLQGLGEQQHVVVDDFGPAAVVALGGGGPLALQGLLADVVAVELGGHGVVSRSANPSRLCAPRRFATRAWSASSRKNNFSRSDCDGTPRYTP
jgi:hypothetical protein